MNLQRPNGDEATQSRNRSSSITPSSGICSRCVDGCKGNCEAFQASFRGRELLYPGPFGEVTAGADKDYPIDYSHLNICGYALGGKGLPEGQEPGPDNTLFPLVNTETTYGTDNKVTMRLPVFTGALGSTEIARVNWEHFAAGAAIAGITIVCGENVCGIDPGLELDRNGKVVESPELRRRVETYKRWHEGYGDLIVQLNVEDTRFGRGRVRGGQAGRRDHRDEVGPGRQVHRRRNPRRRPGPRPGAEEARLPGHARPDRPGRAGRLRGRRPEGVRAPFAASASSARRRSTPRSSACASWGRSASPSRPAPIRCASWPWR